MQKILSWKLFQKVARKDIFLVLSAWLTKTAAQPINEPAKKFEDSLNNEAENENYHSNKINDCVRLQKSACLRAK